MPPDLNADTAPRVDGRRQRGVFTRQKIIEAAISLQLEGNHRASLQQISERAGVSLRTLFEHFPEKQLLTKAILDKLTHFDRTDPPPTELVKHSELPARIALFLDIRVKRLEGLTPHRQVSNVLIARSPLLQKHRLKVRNFYRSIVETWFAPELDPLDARLRERRLNAIATLVDWEMWWSLRTYPDRSVAEAKATLHFLLTAALQSLDQPAQQIPVAAKRRRDK